MIVVEDRIQELFDTLPSVEADGKVFEMTYDFGSEEDLILMLKQEQKKYPLIWLETGFPEEHNNQKDEVLVNLSFKIATYGFTSTLLNQTRLKTTFKDVLFPTLENVRKAFERSNIVMLDQQDWEIEKFYNYGADKLQETSEIWDAIKFDVELTINNDCIREFKYG